MGWGSLNRIHKSIKCYEDSKTGSSDEGRWRGPFGKTGKLELKLEYRKKKSHVERERQVQRLWGQKEAWCVGLAIEIQREHSV